LRGVIKRAPKFAIFGGARTTVGFSPLALCLRGRLCGVAWSCSGNFRPSLRATFAFDDSETVLERRGSLISYRAGTRRPRPPAIMRSTAFRMTLAISRFQAASKTLKSARSSSGVFGLRLMP